MIRVCDDLRTNKKDLFRPPSRLTQQTPVIGRWDIEVLSNWAAVYCPLRLAEL